MSAGRLRSQPVGVGRGGGGGEEKGGHRGDWSTGREEPWLFLALGNIACGVVAADSISAAYAGEGVVTPSDPVSARKYGRRNPRPR